MYHLGKTTQSAELALPTFYQSMSENLRSNIYRSYLVLCNLSVCFQSVVDTASVLPVAQRYLVSGANPDFG